MVKVDTDRICEAADCTLDRSFVFFQFINGSVSSITAFVLVIFFVLLIMLALVSATFSFIFSWHHNLLMRLCTFDAGWSSPVARQAHNLKVASSNLAPASSWVNLYEIGTYR